MALVPDIDFFTRFPEFTGVDEARVQLFLDEALLEIRESEWTDLYTKALMLMTAHLLTLASQTAGAGTGGAGGNFGVVTSRAIGDVSVSFGNSSAVSGSENRSWYNLTPYGQELSRLMNVVNVEMIVV